MAREASSDSLGDQPKPVSTRPPRSRARGRRRARPRPARAFVPPTYASDTVAESTASAWTARSGRRTGHAGRRHPSPSVGPGTIVEGSTATRPRRIASRVCPRGARGRPRRAELPVEARVRRRPADACRSLPSNLWTASRNSSASLTSGSSIPSISVRGPASFDDIVGYGHRSLLRDHRLQGRGK